MDRSKSIGASEVSALFGCSPWQSEYGLWLLKTGLVEQQADTERLRTGRYLEEAILAEWVRRNAASEEVLFVNHNTHQFTSGAHSFITATPDGVGRLKDDTPFVVDVKTVEPMRRADWDNGVPEYYLWQLRQQMYVTGTNRALLIAQFGFHDRPRHEWLEASPALQDELVKRCSKFWKRVEGALPPPDADGHPATTAALQRRKLDAKAINLGDEVANWTRALSIVETDLKRAKEAVAEYKNKIRAAMGDASVGIFGDGTGWRISPRAATEFVTKKKAHTVMTRIKNKDAEDFGDTDE